MRLRYLIIVILSTTYTMNLVGCSSNPFNPYVTWDPAWKEQKKGNEDDQSPDSDIKLVDAHFTLQQGIVYANTARNKYRGKVQDQAIFANGLSSGLIVLGAAVLGLAAYGAGTDAILGTALAGGTGYALGSWFTNRPQQEIYIKGMQAMNCAVEAVLPLKFSIEQLNEFDTQLSTLNASIDSVRSNIGQVEALIHREHDNTIAAAASNLASRSKGIVETANETYISGRQLKREIENAGDRLIIAVDHIGALVDEAIQNTQPDLSALPAVIQGLSDSTNIFAPGLGLTDTLTSALGSTDPELQKLVEDSETPMGKAIRQLETSVLNLTNQSRRVAADVQLVRDNRPLATLKSCGVEIKEADTDIHLSAAVVTFNAKTVEAHRIIVTGGKKPYVAIIVNSPAYGISVRSPVPFDSVVEINASAETQAGGEYKIQIMDASGHSKQVTVQILGKSPGNDSGNDEDSDDSDSLSVDKKIEIQTKLCATGTDLDGDWGEKTGFLVKIWQEVSQEPNPNGKLTNNQIATLNQLEPCETGRLNRFENDLSKLEICKLGLALNLEVKSTIDQDMREKIAQFSDGDPLAVKYKQFTPSLEKKIMDNNPDVDTSACNNL